MNKTGALSRIGNQSFISISFGLFNGNQINSSDLKAVASIMPSHGRFFFIVGDECHYPSDSIPFSVSHIARTINQDKGGIFRHKIGGPTSESCNFLTAAYIGDNIHNDPIIAGLYYADEWKSEIDGENSFYDLIHRLRTFYNALGQSAVLRKFSSND
ncbi:MAG: hypothetical protein ABIJ45_04640, partial [Candidatus Zixiibacteriota bacterium]